MTRSSKELKIFFAQVCKKLGLNLFGISCTCTSRCVLLPESENRLIPRSAGIYALVASYLWGDNVPW